jgi:hypothetical protein
LILSPDDKTYENFPFYAAHAVDEVLVVEPDEHLVRIFALEGCDYAETRSSALLGVDAGTLSLAIEWP